MTGDMIVMSLIIGTAVVLFAWEVFPVDKVSFVILAALVVFRLIDPVEAVSGFGNQATITVGCMLALSYGLERTGAVNFMANQLVDVARGSEFKVLLSTIIAVGFLSAFINNTAAVAIFIPLTLAVAREQNLEASRLLMPMSFAAIMAGTCTLVGTSTNLLVYGLVRERSGIEIGMFEITPLGVIFFLAGTIYLLLVGRRLIPQRRGRDGLTKLYQLREYVTEFILPSGCALIGMSPTETHLGERYGLEILEVWRKGKKFLATALGITLEEGDILLVQGNPAAFIDAQRKEGVRLKALKVEDRDLQDENLALIEAFVLPNSRLSETTLKEINFRRTYRANALAIRRHGRTISEKIGSMRLQPGDSLLVLTNRNNLEVLRSLPDFLLLEEVRLTFVRHRKAILASAIFVGIILVAAFGVLSILEAALIGVGMMLVTECFRLRDLYSNISWTTILMLGCLIPLGAAMENTGLANYVAHHLVQALRGLGPAAVLCGIYVMTSLLTEFLSNNASAVLMLPVALAVSAELAVSPMPFIFGVMFGASFSFMTPVGYQTNTMVYGPGGYRFSDFIKVGIPMNIIFWIMASVLLPVFWPFELP